MVWTNATSLKKDTEVLFPYTFNNVYNCLLGMKQTTFSTSTTGVWFAVKTLTVSSVTIHGSSNDNSWFRYIIAFGKSN